MVAECALYDKKGDALNSGRLTTTRYAPEKPVLDDHGYPCTLPDQSLATRKAVDRVFTTSTNDSGGNRFAESNGGGNE